MNTAFIGLGSNVGDEFKNVEIALKHLLSKCSIEAKSSYYKTLPIGFIYQNDFLNLVIKVSTSLSPFTLLEFLLEVEMKMGRERSIPNGPRIIDLDILFYNDQVVDGPNISIPHPRLHERLFVLIPLVEIASTFVHPVFKKSVLKLSENPDLEIQRKEIRKIDKIFIIEGEN